MLSLARDTSLWRTHSSCGCLIWVCIKPCLESVLDRRGTHWPLPLPAELLTTDPLWKRQHQGLRLRTQWWEFQNLGHTDVSDQVQWVTKQTKRHEHENGARRDEGCVCDGVREIKDGGDGVPTMHHTDTWSYQATNLMNLKVGLGWKVRCDCIQNIRLFFSRSWTVFPWHLPAFNADSGKWPSFTATVAGKSIFSF